MSMKKIIKSFGEFVLDEQIYFYEQRDIRGVMKYRKLSPMFALENWEIYVLPMSGGYMYAIVGLHGGKRFFYAEDSRVCSSFRYYVSAGRDLICKNFSCREVSLLQPKNGVLKNVTYSLKEGCLIYSYVSSLEYVGGVLTVFLQTPRFSCQKRFFLQDEEGYKAISHSEAKQRMESTTSFPLHESFE